MNISTESSTLPTAQDGVEEVIEQREIVSALGELPSEDEVDFAIARAATEKSPGVDGIPIEAFNTSATVASVVATIEEDTEVPVTRRTTRSQSARLNLAATFESFVPANNPNAWRDRDLE